MTLQANYSIRPFRDGDEAALRAVLYAAVHELTQPHYTAAQRAAWAPEQYDVQRWRERIQRVRPFIVECADAIAGFSDLQPTGYIEFFYVAPEFAGRGVARLTMEHLHRLAAERGVSELFSDVSLAAQPFFERQGFSIVARQRVTVCGVELENARMVKQLAR